MKYFSFQWHITDACDQRCKHCYIFSEGHPKLVEMPYEKCLRVLDNMEDMTRRLKRLPYLSITGGDPILHSRFWDLLAEIHHRDIDFCLMGNPYHLTDDVCARLNSLGCHSYQLSLDGLRETHDGFRKPGSFDATLEAIATLRRANINCTVMATVSGTNIEEIPDLIDVVVEHHVDVFAFGRYCPTSQDKISSKHNWCIDPQDYRNLLDRCWHKFEQYRDSGTCFNLKDHLWKLYLYERGLFQIPEGLETDTIYNGCNLAHCHFTITAEGRLMACRRMESYVGTVEEPMYSVWMGPKMDFYRRHEKMEKCIHCELLRFCRGCPAVAYGYHHSWLAPDPQCWKEIQDLHDRGQDIDGQPVSRNHFPMPLPNNSEPSS